MVPLVCFLSDENYFMLESDDDSCTLKFPLFSCAVW